MCSTARSSSSPNSESESVWIHGPYNADPLAILAMCCAIVLFGEHVEHVPLCGPDSARDGSGTLTLALETRDLATSVLAARWDINHATGKARAQNPCGIRTKRIRERNSLVGAIRNTDALAAATVGKLMRRLLTQLRSDHIDVKCNSFIFHSPRSPEP
jgi:hypothetical protein